MWLLLKNVLFTVIVPGTVAVVVPAALRGGSPASFGPLGLAGAVVLLAGIAGYTTCVWHFASVGRGTPAPIDPPKSVVRQGLYRYSRNPMYLSVLLVILGQALLFGSLAIAVYAFGLALTFHLFVVFYEEPTLASAHGAAYRELLDRVPRWLGMPRA